MVFKYSIIIPHKDIPQLLNRCLCSIPQRSDIQIIVVDDNSSDVDQVKLVANNYKGVELVLTSEGHGAGFARNVGLNSAKGDWVLFADADDFFSQNLLCLLDKHYDDDADIVFFAVDSMYSESLVKSPKLDKRKVAIKRYLDNPRKLDQFCRFLHTEPWGKMIKRELIEKYHVTFDETPLANDFYFSIATGFYATKTIFDNTTIYNYTEREGSLSHEYSTNERTLKIRLDVYFRVQDFFDKHNIPYVPFYRYSLSEHLKGREGFNRIIDNFWRFNHISKSYVIYRYIVGKLFQYTFGVHS